MKLFTVLLLLGLALGVPTLMTRLSAAFAHLADDRRAEVQATLLAGEADDTDAGGQIIR